MGGKGVNGGEIGIVSLGLKFWGHGSFIPAPPAAWAAASAATVSKGLVFGSWGSLKEALLLFEAEVGVVTAAEASPPGPLGVPGRPGASPGAIVGLRPSCCV